MPQCLRPASSDTTPSNRPNHARAAKIRGPLHCRSRSGRLHIPSTAESSAVSPSKALTMYYVDRPIPEIDACPGDILVDDPVDGLSIIRRVGATRSILVFRSSSLRPIPQPSFGLSQLPSSSSAGGLPDPN